MTFVDASDSTDEEELRKREQKRLADITAEQDEIARRADRRTPSVAPERGTRIRAEDIVYPNGRMHQDQRLSAWPG